MALKTLDTQMREYAKTLEVIYENRTAGDFTFHGVLAEFILNLENNGIITIDLKSKALETSYFGLACHVMNGEDPAHRDVFMMGLADDQGGHVDSPISHLYRVKTYIIRTNSDGISQTLEFASEDEAALAFQYAVNSVNLEEEPENFGLSDEKS